MWMELTDADGGSRTVPTGDHLGRLHDAIEDSAFAWTLCLIGEDQSSKLAVLAGDLGRRKSSTGEGKQITSGFAYWGIAPTIAWAHACTDPFYPVMQQSIESFGGRWEQVRERLPDTPYHYVSLGVGTGHKDRSILQDLLARSADLLYSPVDLSSEMLRYGMRESLKGVDVPRRQVVPVQLDFAVEANLVEYRRLLHRLVGDEPILFSLLGNTMANFDEDIDLLGKLTWLLRPQDRFLLEVATTAALGPELADLAAEEYRSSRAYKEFVTSALQHYTDLTIDMDSVQFLGAVESDRALQVKIIYQNGTGGVQRIMLPDRNVVRFDDGDTIRLYLTRKYATTSVDEMLRSVGMTKVYGTHSGFASHRAPGGFGIDLYLLSTGRSGPQARSSRADEIWSSFPRTGR
jgi:uncharacterized SAM-dependent methyltransferase